MDVHCMTSSSSFHLKRFIHSPKCPRFPQENRGICFKFRMYNVLVCTSGHTQQGAYGWKWKKRKKCRVKNLAKEPVKISKKKGSIAGAVSLIIGTSIGSGILALPQKTSPAGLLPSSISLTLCWAFLVVEALVLVEINVRLLRKKSTSVKDEDDDELEIISIRRMAEETLGEWGGVLASFIYVFLGYSSMIAYTCKSGEILYHLTNLPQSVSGIFFTSLFTILISVGGTKTTDQLNQWLTASMIGLLIAIEVLATEFGGWSGLGGSGDWGKVPATIPVIIFSLVYHDLAPVLCAYLDGDLKRLRTSVLIGSIVPLVALLVWNTIALDLSEQIDQVVDPVELLTRVRWGGVSYMVEAFSLLAVGTSLIGTLLGFSEFFKEQLNHPLSVSSETRKLNRSDLLYRLKEWWGKKKTSFKATAMVIAPSLIVSTTVPDAFSAATDIAGGYCMTMLYGVLPPAMAWAMLSKNAGANDEIVASGTRPTLICVGLVAGVVLVEQMLQDLSALHS